MDNAKQQVKNENFFLVLYLRNFITEYGESEGLYGGILTWPRLAPSPRTYGQYIATETI